MSWRELKAWMDGHEAKPNPHPVYQLSGDYATLVDGKVPVDQLPPGSVSLSSTDDLAEGVSNLYYTELRVEARIAVHVADSNPHSQYVMRCELQSVPVTTDELSEGSTNLYFTTSRVTALLTSYVQHCELQSVPVTTSDLTEGTNLYYTDLRVDGRIVVHVSDPNPHSQYVMKCELESYDTAGTAAAAILAHVAEPNPHSQYVLHCELPSQQTVTDPLPTILMMMGA